MNSWCNRMDKRGPEVYISNKFPGDSDTAVGEPRFMDCLLERLPQIWLYGNFVVTLTIIHTDFSSNYDNWHLLFELDFSTSLDRRIWFLL